MTRSLVAPVVIGALSLLAATASAQQASPARFGAIGARARGPVVVDMPAVRTPAANPAPAWTRRPLVRRVTAVLGGSALGAGIGYVASQVQMSDWESQAQSPAGQALRRRYSLRGALAGATLGVVIPVGRGGGPLPARREHVPDAIFADQIKAAGAANAYDAVQSLRPRWLVVRDVLTIGQAVGGAVRSDTDVTGDYTVLVYLDRARLGTVESLRQIDLPMIHHITFYNGTEATYRWGWGHPHGVIHVSTTAEEMPD